LEALLIASFYAWVRLDFDQKIIHCFVFNIFEESQTLHTPPPVLSLSLSREREKEISEQFQLLCWYISHKSKKYDTPDSSVGEYFHKKINLKKKFSMSFFLVYPLLLFSLLRWK
jgi:hypothetical protein